MVWVQAALLFCSSLRGSRGCAATIENNSSRDRCAQVELVRCETALRRITASRDRRPSGGGYLPPCEVQYFRTCNVCRTDAGIKSKQLHPNWGAWRGEGESAVAVRVDGGHVEPRLVAITFLPMGKDADAPFQGYLQGSFFPSSNRKAIEPSVALNRLVLDEATSLAAEAVVWLSRYDGSALVREGNTKFSAEQAARAAIDLLVWCVMFPASVATNLLDPRPSQRRSWQG